MKAKVKHLDKLLDAICDKTGQTKTHFGLKEAARQLQINENYLYKNIFDKIKKKGAEQSIGIRDYIMSLIVKFIGYPNYQTFAELCDKPIDKILNKAVGSYYSYVRENSTQGNILRSPARVFIADGSVHFELRGPMQNYRGTVVHVEGCLLVTMNAFSGKSFHHIYKIGKRERPLILVGVFSGVSTAFDPIGGRAVLERREEMFDSLTPERLEIRKLERSGTKKQKMLGGFFVDRLKNNLIIPKPVTFTHEDLAG